MFWPWFAPPNTSQTSRQEFFPRHITCGEILFNPLYSPFSRGLVQPNHPPHRPGGIFLVIFFFCDTPYPPPPFKIALWTTQLIWHTIPSRVLFFSSHLSGLQGTDGSFGPTAFLGCNQFSPSTLSLTKCSSVPDLASPPTQACFHLLQKSFLLDKTFGLYFSGFKGPSEEPKRGRDPPPLLCKGTPPSAD